MELGTDKVMGYAYYADFQVMSVTPAHLFEEQPGFVPVDQEENDQEENEVPEQQSDDVQEPSGGNGWATDGTVQGRWAAPIQKEIVVGEKEVKVEQGNVWKGETSGNVQQAGWDTGATANKNDNNGWGDTPSSTFVSDEPLPFKLFLKLGNVQKGKLVVRL
jgi:hypothetical protein